MCVHITHTIVTNNRIIKQLNMTPVKTENAFLYQ